MKTQQTLTITTLGFLALLSCGIVFHLSCRKEDSCSGCYLTNDQLAFIIYTKGEKVIFKNDTTSILDTLYAEGNSYGPSNCSSPCDEQSGSVTASFTFNYLSQFNFQISSNGDGTPIINFYGGYGFSVNPPPTHTVTLNGTTYNDVYSMQIDSTKITAAFKQTVPWKIYYSQSKGFVRFYMLNGQTWSKL